MKRIEIILHEDSIKGVKSVSYRTKNIVGIFIPRQNLNTFDLGKIEKLGKQGIYFLVGNNDKGDLQLYVGQSKRLPNRVIDHKSDKLYEAWDYAIIFSVDWLKESDLNYIESKCIQLAGKSGVNVLNGNNGNSTLATVIDKEECDEFVEDCKPLLQILGYNFLEEKISNLTNKPLYYIKLRGSDASMYSHDGIFTVLKGSKGPRKMQKNVIDNKGYAYRNRPILIDNGTIKEEGDYIVFLKDTDFDSCSSAASLILGASVNGRITWKTEDNKYLSDVEDTENKHVKVKRK